MPSDSFAGAEPDVDPDVADVLLPVEDVDVLLVVVDVDELCVEPLLVEPDCDGAGCDDVPPEALVPWPPDDVLWLLGGATKTVPRPPIDDKDIASSPM